MSRTTISMSSTNSEMRTNFLFSESKISHFLIHLSYSIILFNKKLESIGIQLHFGANGSDWKTSQLDWIERYGFYEGGDVNEYRLDPRFILATLTGQVPEGEALDVLIRRLEGKLEQILPADEAKRLEIQLANARGLKTPGYTPKPVPPLAQNQ